ncbi:type II and III secretion system protein family protein [uncultured Xylophilus sp.]|uniref:type II and III secretion system protein family protein n=1 Tax=uncultured Xylophilus sp. TaxID=296832 RepID=UPI0025CE8B22|nr:type II and III secretion system protein family protein [uncultured Xylophilus sp.]
MAFFASHAPRLLRLRRPALLVGCAAAVLAWHGAARPQAADAVLELAVGAQEALVLERGVDRIAVADDRIAGVTLGRTAPGSSAAHVILTGKAPGATTVLLWPRGGGAVQRHVVEVRRPVLVLDRTLRSLPEHREALATAAAEQGPDRPVLDRMQVGVRSHTVQVDVRVVEFNRNVLRQAGINLFGTGPNSHGFNFGLFSPSSLRSSTFGPAGAIATDASAPFAQAFGLLLNFGKAGIGANLGLLENQGLARVLAEPTLVALSGQSANFLAGGEIPVPVPQGLGTTSIRYKSFGIGLTVTPTVLEDDRIVLKVAPEASDLDYTNAVTLNGVSVPAITTRRADTTVELGDGESFLIGGLVSRRTLSSVDQVPLLGDLPVIGAFFKRQNYQRNESELVIVVTPRLVKPLARGTELDARLPGQAAERTAEPGWRSYLLGRPDDEALPGFSR